MNRKCHGGPLDGMVSNTFGMSNGQMADFPLAKEKIEYAPNFTAHVYVATDYPVLGSARYQVQRDRLQFMRTFMNITP